MNNEFKNWFFKIEEDEKSVEDLINKNGMILFFTRDDDVFGSSEEDRISFAKLKDKDPEETEFSAINLIKSLLNNDIISNLFQKSDLSKIKVCDKEEAVKKIIKRKEKNNEPSICKR